jgi:Yip1 domain
MAAPASYGAPAADERVWLQRALFVLVRPREVLEGLRDDSDASARARSEAVLALVLLAGIGSVLWTPVAGTLMDVKGPHAEDGLEVAIWAFLGGSVYGAVVFFVGGLVLYALTRIAGGVTYRQSRHLLAFASAPIALSLFVVWPVRLAVYGEDLFRSGGSDHGAGNAAFVVLELVFAGWSLALLAVGLRALLRR